MWDEGREQQQRTASAKLLEELPQLCDLLEHDQVEAARQAVRVPVIELRPGPWTRAMIAEAGVQSFGAVVVSGLVTRHLDIGGHPALDLLGPGDLIGAHEMSDSLLPARDALSASVATRLAILDDRFLVAARRWPRLMSCLFQQTQEQHDRLLFQLVIAEQPRVDERLLTLFWHLAERFGHVTSDGLVVSLALTHEALGRLVGARRPSVTSAIGDLGRDHLLERTEDGWLLRGDPAHLVDPVTERLLSPA
jgi:CRP/FNR family transcriptional regulator, cyclic AMP receptor protein